MDDKIIKQKGEGEVISFYDDQDVIIKSLEGDEKIENIKKDLILKYKHIDPFEEEIWEQYHNITPPPKFKIGDKVICSGIQDDLNINDQVGMISWRGYTGTRYIYTINFEKKFSTQFDYDNSWNVEENKIRIYNIKEEEIRMKKRKEASLRNIDKDPFQEEIWEGVKKFKKFI
jgi:hypothetical protein